MRKEIRNDEGKLLKIQCDCKRWVEIYGFTNTCDCGRDFNFAGTLLADREQWGEETGERWYECY